MTKTEQALERISGIIEDRIHSMKAHASVYSSDRESAQMMAEASELVEALSTLREAEAELESARPLLEAVEK